jgi:hypothetical protein
MQRKMTAHRETMGGFAGRDRLLAEALVEEARYEDDDHRAEHAGQ